MTNVLAMPFWPLCYRRTNCRQSCHWDLDQLWLAIQSIRLVVEVFMFLYWSGWEKSHMKYTFDVVKHEHFHRGWILFIDTAFKAARHYQSINNRKTLGFSMLWFYFCWYSLFYHRLLTCSDVAGGQNHWEFNWDQASLLNKLKTCAQVAENVGCPTDDRMVACLKSSNAKNLTMAIPHVKQSSPDREHPFPVGLSGLTKSEFNHFN